MQEALQRFPNLNTASTYEFGSQEYLEEECEKFNQAKGYLDSSIYNCNKCKNKGIYSVVCDGEIVNYPCSECSNIRKCIVILKNSGLEKLTFKDFIVNHPWQKNLLDIAKKYVADTKGEWLYIGGQSGCGKTHICTGVLREFVVKYNISIEYMKWAEASKKLKALINDEDKYFKELNPYKTVKVLYIDDFLKVRQGESPTNADINLAYELLDYRYSNKLLTVISSEFSLDQIINFDEAIGGRIKQKADSYAVYISKDRAKNYRLK